MDRILLDFLGDLKENNNRDWFQSNKERYLAAKSVFEHFVDELIPHIRLFDPQIDLITAKDCTFRIYRDVRFSKDKSPYKPNMGAYIAKGGKSSPMSGYYVHVEPGASFLAGGIYMPQPDILKKIRQEIFYQFPEFLSIVNDPGFRGYFGIMDDEGKMKKPPKDYPADFPGIDYLKFRSFAVMHPVDDQWVLSDGYTEYAEKVFQSLYPLNAFFNRMFE